MHELLKKARARLNDLRTQRDQAQTAARTITDTAESETRDLTDEEWEQIREHRSSANDLDEQIREQEQRISDLEDQIRDDEQRSRAAGQGGNPTDITVGEEERTYRPDGESFFGDMVRARMGDREAEDRLQRHREEARVDEERRSRERGVRTVATGDMNGLLPPQYLNEWYADNIHAGFQFGRLLTQLPLPDDGMVFNIPRGGTSPTSDVQATEGGAVSNTDASNDPDLDVHVVTIAGATEHSFQLRDRGAGADRIIVMDLYEDYYTKFDRQLLSGSGWATGKQHEGVLNSANVNSVTYTDATPTGEEFLSKIAQAASESEDARNLPCTAIVMHSRRWHWLTQQRDSTGRPLVPPANAGVAQNADGVQLTEPTSAGDTGPTLVGIIGNLPVYTVQNIPKDLGAGSNEDAVLVGRLSDILLWLDGGDITPREFAVSSVDPAGAGNEVLVARVVVYGYSAMTADRRPEGISVITGTGLIAPTF